MSCYKCGAPEGNEARLCPTCNSKRNTDQEANIELIAPRFNDVEVASLTPQQKKLALIGSGLFIIGVFWLLIPSHKETNVEFAEKIFKSCSLIKSSTVKIASNDLSVMIAATECETIKELCTTQPTHLTCQQIASLNL